MSEEEFYIDRTASNCQLSRRDFIQCVGVTALTTGFVISPAIAWALSSNKKDSYIYPTREKNLEDLSEYMYIEYPTENEDGYSYLIVREQPDKGIAHRGEYHYYSLNINEEGYFTDEIISSLELFKTETSNSSHIKFKKFLELIHATSCIPALEVIEKHIGIKNAYSTDDYKHLCEELDKKVNQNNIIKVKTK